VAGLATALVPVVGIAARPGGGWLTGYLDGRHRLLMGCGLLAGLLAMVLIPLTGSAWAFFFLIAVAAFSIQLSPGISYVLTRDLAGPETVGTSLAVLTTISLAGSFLSPMVGGWLIGHYSWTVVFGVFGGVGLAGIAFLLPIGTAG
jgi:NNP family nitrate/nitrite transporter-like MFS transporter